MVSLILCQLRYNFVSSHNTGYVAYMHCHLHSPEGAASFDLKLSTWLNPSGKCEIFFGYLFVLIYQNTHLDCQLSDNDIPGMNIDRSLR